MTSCDRTAPVVPYSTTSRLMRQHIPIKLEEARRGGLYWLQVKPDIQYPVPFFVVVQIVEIGLKWVEVVAVASDNTSLIVHVGEGSVLLGLFDRKIR